MPSEFIALPIQVNISFEHDLQSARKSPVCVFKDHVPEFFWEPVPGARAIVGRNRRICGWLTSSELPDLLVLGVDQDITKDCREIHVGGRSWGVRSKEAKVCWERTIGDFLNLRRATPGNLSGY